MLLKSGINLEDSVTDFVSLNKSVTLFSAYIKLDELERINISKNIKQIIVRWEIEDLCKKVSDLEIYDYCIDNGITLYRNSRIHLKTLWDGQNSIILGSANVTGRGVGEKGDNFNYELNAFVSPISFEDIQYFHYLINESEYVTEELYYEIKMLIKSIELPKLEFPKLVTRKKTNDYFLISQLPMSDSPELLYEIYSNKNYPLEDQINASHDLSIYNIQPSLTKYDFFETLKTNFNKHPFIIALKEHILSEPNQSLRYGGVVTWIQNKTTTVPTPRSWELKKDQLVNVLYTWICYFDSKYTWNVPGSRSQVIFYNE
jgi:hypothetical protein